MPDGGQQTGFAEWRERERNYLEYLDSITSNPLQEQEKILTHILGKNAETEYLRMHEMNGAVDVESFRERLPVSDYDTYKPYVDRIFEGDTSPSLCADPVVEILTSSGTSGGEPKLFPVTAEDLELRGVVWNMMRPVLNRELPGLEKGKVLFFYFIRSPGVSPSGIPCHPAVTSFVKSSCFKRRPFDPSYILTSPDEVTESMDSSAALYCHLLLGLLQREEVVRFGAIFAPVIMKALSTLEELLQEICDDIANGTLNPSKVKDGTVRAAVLPFLRKDPELAELVRREFQCTDPAAKPTTDGIIRRLWPNVKVIDTICTGSMAAYLPALANYSDNLPVICTQLYAATEGYFGINLHPMCPIEEIYYTLLPSAAYYEFIALSGSNQQKSEAAPNEVLDLVSLKEGQEYEMLVTTVSGLYRYRMGDILKVVGFYNSAPTFQFVRRMNTVLSIDTDKTDEKELHTAVSKAVKLLEKNLGLRLVDYTSTADRSSKPGHYVIFLEMVTSSGTAGTHDEKVLELSCSVMEESLNFIYRRGRHENIIGALEMRLVQEKTFDLLANNAIDRGATLSQYKTPRGLDGRKSSSTVEILNFRVSQSVFSQERPSFSQEALNRSGKHVLKKNPSGQRMLLEGNSGQFLVT